MLSSLNSQGKISSPLSSGALLLQSLYLKGGPVKDE